MERIRRNHPLPFLTYIDETLASDEDYDAGLSDRTDRVYVDEEIEPEIDE